MATGWASPKKENLNFARLCRLLIDGGTRALRDVFDSIHSPSSLRTTLLSTAVHSTLKGLRAKRILTKQQWDRLYPSSKTTPVTSADFDITLLFVLIRNICGLTPPPSGWDKPPVATDLSREADLARVKYYRNELYGHTTETVVSDSDFEKYWSAISDVLVRLGGPCYKPEIEKLKIIAMDVEDEKYFIKILEEWEQTEQSLKNFIKNSEQRVMDKLEEMEGNLVNSKLEQLQRGQDGVAEGQSKLQRGQDAVAEAQSKLQQGQDNIAEATSKLQQGQDGIAEGQSKLQRGQDNIAEATSILQQGQDGIAEGQSKLQRGQDNIAEGQSKLQRGQDGVAEAQSKLQQGQEKILKELSSLKQDERRNLASHTKGDEQSAINVTYNITVKDHGNAAVGPNASFTNVAIERTSDQPPEKDLSSRALEYTEKLKSSIKKQTDFLLAKEEDKKIRTDDIFTNVTIERGQKQLNKTGPEEKRYGRRQMDEVPESRTALKTCSEMFVYPENDQKSTASGATNPKSILLTGKAGIGKSLFCRKLVRDWSDDKLLEKNQEKPKVPDFQFVFLLTFRQFLLPEEEKVDLRDILNKSSLLDEHSTVDEPLLQYIIEHPEKLVIILDGYDEYKHREKITGDFETRYSNNPYEKIPVPALLAKIMKGKMLKESVVVVSSRPGEAEELKEIEFDVRCDIQGFSSPQVIDYIKRYFKENESMKKEVLEHIQSNEILLSLGHIPVMCYLMCSCIKWYMTESKTTEKLPVTRTQLYYQVIILFIKKHSSSKYEEMEESQLQEILHKLAELAMNLTKKGQYIFEEKDMKKLNFKDEDITNLKASGLLDCCPGVKKSPSEKPPLEYTFTHLTIQEYLCAFLFVEKKEIPKREETSTVTLEFVSGILSTKKEKKSDATYTFPAWIWSRKKEEKLMKKLLKNIKPEDKYDERNKLLTLSCLYEYKDDGFSTRVINNLKHRYCDEDGEIVFIGITDIDCLYISYLLDIVNIINAQHTQSFNVNTLFILSSSLSASGIRMLCNSLVISTVTKLMLFGCKLDDECVVIISNVLSHTNITNLHLEGNNITDDGVVIISNVLSRTNITHLHLSNNNITDNGCKCLVSVLKTSHCRVTWLELYDNDKITDECTEWAEQQEIPDVEIVLSRNNRTATTIPPEILVRSPEALKAYKEALKMGKTKNRRVLVTVVGPSRAGKTSLLKTLKGEEFDPEEDSTTGVVLQKAFCKPQEKSWFEEGNGEDDLSKKSICEFMAQKLKNNQKREGKTATETTDTNYQAVAERHPSNKDLDEYEEHEAGESVMENKSLPQSIFSESSKVPNKISDAEMGGQRTSEHEVSLNTLDFPIKENTSSPQSDFNEISQVPKEIRDSFVNHKPGQTSEDEISLKTLDFAGQQVYEVVLPLFMSSKSIYVLVYNLENDLFSDAQPKVKHGNSERELENHFQMTHLDTQEFWLSCISSYTKKEVDSDGSRTQVALPPVFVVCTHADVCNQDPKEVAGELCKILTRPENPYGKHVVPNVYTVDNTISGKKEVKDESAKRLKADVEKRSKLLPQVNEDIPVSWLRFEEELSKLVEKEQKKYVYLEEAMRIATKCNVNTNTESIEFTTLLNYLHDLKKIIYFEETRTVFIDTQWLVDMFVKVITVMPFQEWKEYADYWRKLEDKSILQRALVEHVWSDIASDGQNTIDSLLLIMEKFSLICPWKLNEEDVYLVPCMLCNSKRTEDIEMLLADHKSSTMVIRFKSVHLPMGIFPRLFVALAEHGKKEWPEIRLKLRPNFCRMFNVGQEGRFDICITSGIRTICVTVYNKNNIDGPSVTKFCQSLRTLLEKIFDAMQHTCPRVENMELEYGIRCPVCTKSKMKMKCSSHKSEGCKRDSCLHFVGEKELKLDRPECYEDDTNPDTLIREETYSHWFPKTNKRDEAHHLETNNHEGGASGNAGCQELVIRWVGVQDLATISSTTAADKLAEYLQLDKSSMADPPAEIQQKCRAFCLQLKKIGRHDIIIELRETLPSGMTGPLLDDDKLYQELDFKTRRDLTRALCGNDLWKYLASELQVSGDHFGYFERQQNPAKAMLEDEINRNLKVVELYDLLVQCDAGALADKYL